MTNFSGKPLSPKTGNAACGGPQGGGMDSRRNGVAEVSPKYLADIATNGIPVGYMQTEIGMIPEDWEVQDFGSLFQSTVSKKTIKPGTLVSFVGMQDVTERAQLADQHLIPIENVRSGFTYFERGDVLIAKITPCFENGKGCHTELLHSDIGFGSTEFHVLRANDISDSRFIYYWSNREVFRKSLESEMVGSAGHRRVPLSAISNYQIPVPPKAEQTAIAQALSDVDALISELEKLIAKKQAIKTATMQQLLTGRTRLPQFALREDGTKKGTKKSELGEVPEDWEIYSLGQLIKGTQLGGNYKNSEQETGQPLIKMGNLGRGYIKLDKLEFVVGKAKEVDRLEFGDLLFNTRNTLDLVGKVSVWRNELSVAFFNSNLMRITFDPALIGSNFYMNAVMNSNDFVNALSDIAIGTTSVAAIYSRDLFQLKVSLPPKEEQTAIATILSDMDAEIQAQEQRLGKIRQIKQGMMQELLTGKTRLIKPSKEVIHE